MHYKRWKRNGDPLTRKKPANGEVVKFFEDVVRTYEGDDCLIWPYAKYPSGYGHLFYNGADRTASRLVCEYIYGSPPTDIHEAAHSCGNGRIGCVSPKHVRWATPVENMRDQILHGTQRNGEKSNFAKLTATQVMEIRALKGVETHSTIARRFSLTPSAIGLIQRGKRWKHLEEDCHV
jgi:hypothetical protein